MKKQLTAERPYELELHNMAILKSIRHPNIIPLLAAYSYRQKFNFIFPRAPGGTLQSLLKSDQRPHELQPPQALLVALTGLSSAICAMHDCSTAKLKMIGCHRDLRTENVLVNGSEFQLIDFGLSKFTEAHQSSGSTYTEIKCDYVAPECQDLDDLRFTCHKVGRASDIWSFGCLVADLLTYVVRGSKGVREFQKRRRNKSLVQGHPFTYRSFHKGRNKPNENVEDWLCQLENDSALVENDVGEAVRDLLQFVRRMLSIWPEQRPKAAAVEARLRSIAVLAVSQSINQRLCEIIESTRSIQVLIEQRRFRGWLWATAPPDERLSQDFDPEWISVPLERFRYTLRHLEEFQEYLNNIKRDFHGLSGRTFDRVRFLNDVLLGALPITLQRRAREHVEIHLLEFQNPHDLDELAQKLDPPFQEVDVRSRGLPDQNPDQRLAQLLRVKRWQEMITSLGALTRSDLHIDVTCLRDVSWEHNFSKHLRRVELVLPRHSASKLAIAEEKLLHLDQTDTTDELLSRLASMADLLKRAARNKVVRALPCRGFYSDTAKFSCGLIYDFPPDTDGPTTNCAVTLTTALGKSEVYPQPMLGDRFRLAHGLAASLLDFSKTGWLLKSISARNIAFFHRQGMTWNPQNFYFLGFVHSRRDDASAYSEGTVPGDDEKYYLDPDYTQKRSFQARHDYYAFGVILLEIGFWKSLPGILQSGQKAPKPGQLSKTTRESLVLQMGPLMGVTYRDSIATCFSCTSVGVSGDQADQKGTLATQMEFRNMVVDRLARCSA